MSRPTCTQCIAPFAVAFIGFIICHAPPTVRASQPVPVTVTYISHEAVYINGGTRNGLAVGDTLPVHRGDVLAGHIRVTHVSSHSAACVTVEAGLQVLAGDVVSVPTGTVAEAGPRNSPAERRPSSSRGKKSRLRGYLGYQHGWQRDLGDPAVSWSQPGGILRFTVSDVGGRDVELRVRHRSYAYRRDASTTDRDAWVHRLSEASVTIGTNDAPVEMGLGRVLSPYIRGIGYVDGAYVTVRVRPGYRVGAAVGAAPDETDSSFRSSHVRAGGFMTFERGSRDARHLSTTMALSMSRVDGVVNREFVYVQSRLSIARRLSLYQSVEMDVHRQWRKTVTGERVSFSNLYVTGNWQPAGWFHIDGAFDARKNVRTYRTIETPDSLFDDSVRRGMSGGFTVRAPAGVTLRAHTGVRYGDDRSDEIRFASASMTVRNFIFRTHHLSARLSRSETRFTTGYRPMLAYRFPALHRITATVGGGAYLYDTEGIDNDSYFYDLGLQRTFAGRYYLSGTTRHYTGGALESVQANLEVGVNF